MKNTIFTYFLVCQGLSNDDVGVPTRGTVFEEIWPGAGFKTGDFVKEKLGATVERLSLSKTDHIDYIYTIYILCRLYFNFYNIPGIF